MERHTNGYICSRLHFSSFLAHSFLQFSSARRNWRFFVSICCLAPAPSSPISLSHSTFLKIYRLNWKKVTRSKRGGGWTVESHNLHASLLQWWQTFMLKIFLEVATFLQQLSELFPRVLTLWGYVFIFFLFFAEDFSSLTSTQPLELIMITHWGNEREEEK